MPTREERRSSDHVFRIFCGWVMVLGLVGAGVLLMLATESLLLGLATFCAIISIDFLVLDQTTYISMQLENMTRKLDHIRRENDQPRRPV